MKNEIKHSGGFTLIEMIIVITVMTIVLTSFLAFNARTVANVEATSQVNQLVETLRLAQARAMTGYQNDEWSVYLASDHYTLFKGSDYDLRDFNHDITNELPGQQTLDNVLLNGGGDILTFRGIDGDTENYGSMQLVDDNLIKTISVNNKGIIEINET